jgi:hypothetical protein
MSYEDMARSHVKELVREAFELDEVVVDEDGDFPFPFGSAMFYASLESAGRLLKVWSCAVRGVPISKAVLREIDEVNTGLIFARVFTRGTSVMVEGCLPVESLRAHDVGFLCSEVGRTADRVGSMLAAVHGGHVTFPAEDDVDEECEGWG